MVKGQSKLFFIWAREAGAREAGAREAKVLFNFCGVGFPSPVWEHVRLPRGCF